MGRAHRLGAMGQSALALAVLAATALGVQQMIRPAAFEAETAMFRERRSDDSGDVRLAAGGQVQPGDKLFMEIEASEQTHVYVINQDDQGEEYLHRILDAVMIRVEADVSSLATGQVDLRAAPGADVVVVAQQTASGQLA